MRLKLEQHYLSILSQKHTFWAGILFCFQVYVRRPKLGVDWWDIVHFPLDKLHDGLKVKQALLPPKQDIQLFLFGETPSNDQPENTMKGFSSQTFSHSSDNTVHPVLFLQQLQLLVLQSQNKYKSAKLVENRCLWIVCQIHSKDIFVAQFFPFHNTSSTVPFQAGSNYTFRSDLIREAF